MKCLTLVFNKLDSLLQQNLLCICASSFVQSTSLDETQGIVAKHATENKRTNKCVLIGVPVDMVAFSGI